jgi:predicted AlkP superfamily phosphohydrolase/phosphomutase
VAELEERFGKYPLHLKTLMFSAGMSVSGAKRLLSELRHEVKVKFEVAHYLLDTYEPDFCILHVLGTDRVQHELWSLFDPQDPRHNEEMTRQCAESVIDYFAQIDAEIARLYEKFDQDAATFIISDHGFGPIHKLIDLNVWLLENGYIETQTAVGSRLKSALWRRGLTKELFTKLALRTFFKHGAGIAAKIPDESIFKSMLFLARWGQGGKLLFSFDDVDWSRTKAYALAGMGAININLRGREPRGSVPPGDEYQAVKEEIAERLRNLRDPNTGEPIAADVYLREEIYHGPYLDRAPDIMFLPNASRVFAGSMTGFSSNRWIFENSVWPGHHCMEGILLAIGERFKKGKCIEGARLIDLAPTILHVLGNKIPSDMDGRVLTGLFDEAFLEHHPVEYRSPDEDLQAPVPLPGEDEEDVMRRLKDLGYLL